MNDPVCVVIIGRNEGERLKDCLRSVIGITEGIVYVDSGSSDGSVEYACSKNVAVVELDMSLPFSAARARNEGFFHLICKYPEFQFVQFIDGDCQLCGDWLAPAKKYLQENPGCAIVAGRRAERYPEKSVYNLLCDIEWDTPIGEAKACGGDFMIRRESFEKAGGFNPEVVAGEEPELCYRLRRQGWTIYRLGQLMTIHDADITRFNQWWMRAVRSGHAYAQGLMLHGFEGKGYCVRASLRIWFWAFLFPGLISGGIALYSYKIIFLSSLYFVHFIKIAISLNKRQRGIKRTLIYALFNIVGNFPLLFGQAAYLFRRFRRKNVVIVEYK
jgi:GT2 family glycosyltransferase